MSPNNITGFIDFNNSLVGWWRFNREAGENDTFVRDWSEYGNNGTMTNMNKGINNGTSDGQVLESSGMHCSLTVRMILLLWKLLIVWNYRQTMR